MNCSNPYESPPAVPDAGSPLGQRSFIPSCTVLFWLILVPLIGFIPWAIFHVSPIGIILPAAIGFVVAFRCSATLRRTLLSIALAYLIGVSAIIFADIVTESIYGSMRLSDDVWRTKVTQIWAACGTLGAIAGAALGVRNGQSKPTPDRTEP